MAIVVGFLKTPEGEAAVDAAVEEARMRGSDLVVVHSMREAPTTRVDDVLDYREELARLRERLGAAGVRADVHELVRGNDPATDLLAVAEQVAAELIVIGVRRRSPVGKLLLGSTAQRVLLDADCPVLAVKPAPE